MTIPDPPLEPPVATWDLRAGMGPASGDLIGVGADLEPGTLLAAYRLGLFPMGVGTGGSAPMGWWCPVQRGVIRPGHFHVSRSLRRSAATITIAVDSAFDAVVFRCATTHTDGNWITPEIANAYAALHRLGWAHSIEAWSAGRLVGGVYGVSIGGLFAGESMFHEATDASKVALAGLAAILAADGDSRRLIDVQWQTSHLATLGAVEIPRSDYLATLSGTLNAPPIRWNALANRPWRWTPDGLTGVSI